MAGENAIAATAPRDCTNLDMIINDLCEKRDRLQRLNNEAAGVIERAFGESTPKTDAPREVAEGAIAQIQSQLTIISEELCELESTMTRIVQLA